MNSLMEFIGFFLFQFQSQPHISMEQLLSMVNSRNYHSPTTLANTLYSSFIHWTCEWIIIYISEHLNKTAIFNIFIIE